MPFCLVSVTLFINSHVVSSSFLPGEQGLFPSGSRLHQTGACARFFAQPPWNQFGMCPTTAE